MSLRQLSNGKFYGTFKTEFISKHRFSSDEELNDKTIDYVYMYYNHVRPHSFNGYRTPFEKNTGIITNNFFPYERYKKV